MEQVTGQYGSTTYRQQTQETEDTHVVAFQSGVGRGGQQDKKNRLAGTQQPGKWPGISQATNKNKTSKISDQ
jgi:hypothetical protein